MATLTLRLVKGSPLTNQEVDDNFSALNSAKYESGDSAVFSDVQLSGGVGTAGTLSWNTDEETVDLIQNGSTLQIGQEVQYNVRNDTASAIADGTPVMATGTIGASGRITIAPMDATDPANARYYLGVATETIAAGEDGKVAFFGKVRGIDLSAYSEGDVLWLSTDTVGALTATEPAIGTKIATAFVINNSATVGTMFVRATNSIRLQDVDDVQITGVTDGELLVYNSTLGGWENQTIAEAGLATSAQGDLADTALQDGDTVSSLDINGGTIDGTVIGGSSAAAGTFTEVSTGKLSVGTELEWSAGTDTYTARTVSGVTSVHENMKRCVLNDNGTVNYYLDPTDSTLKADGTASVLDGTDGNVMVEIPRFYYRVTYTGNVRKWEVSDVPLAGYALHPAFFKNGEIVDFRYIGAYDACVYDDSVGSYISGTNLDDMTSNIDFVGDELASVSGVYPIVGVTRDECRTLAENIGSGWRQQDFWLTSAIQILYLVEYGDFNSQDNLGDGNTNGSYIGSSSSQSDSPHTIAGASNAWGNASTDGTQPSAGAKPGTAYMSYRGIENLFGNCWNWVDGVNIGSGVQGDWHVSNDDTVFADNTTTNYDFLVNSMPADGYVTDIAEVDGAFIPSATGGSSSTYLADYFFDDNGNTNRVARFGGGASNGGLAGAFCWGLSFSSAGAGRNIGARVAF